jgi:hypothetical protein
MAVIKYGYVAGEEEEAVEEPTQDYQALAQEEEVLAGTT